MDWAYRIMASNKLDGLGVAIVLHLGWRDAASQRTDKGIARALGQHRGSVQKATAKLAAAGIIARRSGQWVAVETIRIVEEAADAKRPDAASTDGGPTEEAPPVLAQNRGPTEEARGGLLRRPQRAYCGGPKRKENLEKDARVIAGGISRASAPPYRGGQGLFELSKLSERARYCASIGQDIPLGDGRSIKAGTLEAERVRQAVRAQDAENIQGATA